MNKYIVPILAGAILSVANASDADLKKEIELLKAQLKALEAKVNSSSSAKNAKDIKSLKKTITDVKIHDGGDNIKFTADLRVGYDKLKYETTNGTKTGGSVLSNRLILDMAAKPTDSLIFKGALQVNSLYGSDNVKNTGADVMAGYQNNDWFASETPDDVTVRLKEAYFIYFGNFGKMTYTASFGRRPATTGMLTNLREDDAAKSPIGHNINMEFEGASFKFDVGKLMDVEGAYAKLCLGRGYSGVNGKYSANGTPSYAKESSNMDLTGLIIQLYDDSQYKAVFNYFRAVNVLGLANPASFYTPNPDPSLKSVGNITGGAFAVQVNGIGDEISDFLDDTTVFASYAWSETDPDENGGGMLGSMDKEKGHSYYVGLQVPFFTDGGRFGLEYNKGSKYWRSFTYGEDTMSGSKLAARGKAYEAYITQPLIGKTLSMQLRYTKIDYDYTGSEGFFGNGGTPMDVDTSPNALKKSDDIRLYIRYRYLYLKIPTLCRDLILFGVLFNLIKTNLSNQFSIIKNSIKKILSTI